MLDAEQNPYHSTIRFLETHLENVNSYGQHLHRSS